MTFLRCDKSWTETNVTERRVDWRRLRGEVRSSVFRGVIKVTKGDVRGRNDRECPGRRG